MIENIIDYEFLTETEKNQKENLLKMADRTIAELVVPKTALLKAYNYYHGQRDPEQFRYLEENYGIGNPTSVEFVPLVKKHIDALIGEFLSTPIIPKVTCKDSSTISNIQRDLKLKISSEIVEKFKHSLNNMLVLTMTGEQIDHAVEADINKIIGDLNESFLSDYEIAALNVVEYILQNPQFDFKLKLKHILLDLLVAGMYFNRVKSSQSKTNINIEVLNPLQVFTDYNLNSTDRRDDYRAVVVKYLSKSQILAEYGLDLDKKNLAELKNNLKTFYTDLSSTYIISSEGVPGGVVSMPGLIAYTDITPGLPNKESQVIRSMNPLIPVFEVEWIASNKTDNGYRMDRYEVVRIGKDIYIYNGKNEDIVRSVDNPNYCSLSISGTYFQNRNSLPFSLMRACMGLQDKYDLLNFFRDNIIASAGGVGMTVNVNQIPQFLGADLTERLLKWLAIKKTTGVAVTDPNQEGNNFNDNTQNQVYDETVRLNAIQAVELAINRIEETCSSITGVFRERLNGIEQRDAVKNIEVGINNSFIITKQYYDLMDRAVNNLLIDSLNVAKVVYKNGLTGSLILGDYSQKVFTALPEHFTVTDYDVHIIASSEIMTLIEEIKQLAVSFIQAGKIDESAILEIITARSITEMKRNVKKALAKRLAEIDLVNQLMQLIELLTNENKLLNKDLKSTTDKLEELNEKKLTLEEKKIDLEDERERLKIRSKERMHHELMENKKVLLELEAAQLYDDNNKNDKIKNVV